MLMPVGILITIMVDKRAKKVAGLLIGIVILRYIELI